MYHYLLYFSAIPFFIILFFLWKIEWKVKLFPVLLPLIVVSYFNFYSITFRSVSGGDLFKQVLIMPLISIAGLFLGFILFNKGAYAPRSPADRIAIYIGHTLWGPDILVAAYLPSIPYDGTLHYIVLVFIYISIMTPFSIYSIYRLFGRDVSTNASTPSD